MPRQLLTSLRRRVRALLPGDLPASAAAGADGTLDVLQSLHVAERLPGEGTRFGAFFQAAAHRSAAPAERLDAAVRARARELLARQPDYQPVYGYAAEFPARRTAHLERNVETVHTLLGDVASKHQPRILDVGCNLGYVALRIAETYPNVVGLEISQPHLELCRLLAARAGSSARFFGDDLLAMLARDDDDLESVDVVLLYNVVHQFIFLNGLPATQALIAKIARKVDTVVIELAHRADYVKHGKDHLLPADPAEALAACTDVDIELLHAKPRPVYRIRRRTVRYGPIAVDAGPASWSLNPDPLVSRKYHRAPQGFLKVYRFSRPGDRDIWAREVDALQRLAGTGVAPALIASHATAHVGATLMAQVDGDRLIHRIYRPGLDAQLRLRALREVLRIARVVLDKVGYQNDLQAHNLLLTPANRLVLVDYEQAGAAPTNDPFGLLVWSVFDLWGGRSKDRAASIRSLRIGAPGPRRLPDFTGIPLPPRVAELVEEARAGGDWGAFLARWTERLAPVPRPARPAPGKPRVSPAKRPPAR